MMTLPCQHSHPNQSQNLNIKRNYWPGAPSLTAHCLALKSTAVNLFYSSSPDSLNADRSDKSAMGSASPHALYKLVVPLLRCEVVDVRDAAVNALGLINHDALK